MVVEVRRTFCGQPVDESGVRIAWLGVGYHDVTRRNTCLAIDLIHKFTHCFDTHIRALFVRRGVLCELALMRPVGSIRWFLLRFAFEDDEDATRMCFANSSVAGFGVMLHDWMGPSASCIRIPFVTAAWAVDVVRIPWNAFVNQDLCREPGDREGEESGLGWTVNRSSRAPLTPQWAGVHLCTTMEVFLLPYS